MKKCPFFCIFWMLPSVSEIIPANYKHLILKSIYHDMCSWISTMLFTKVFDVYLLKWYFKFLQSVITEIKYNKTNYLNHGLKNN